MPITDTAGNELRNRFIYFKDQIADPLFDIADLLVKLSIALQVLVNQIKTCQYGDLGGRRELKFAMDLAHFFVYDLSDFLDPFCVHIFSDHPILIAEDVHDNLIFFHLITMNFLYEQVIDLLDQTIDPFFSFRFAGLQTFRVLLKLLNSLFQRAYRADHFSDPFFQFY